ncbi:hypothetical protein Hanom_Chr11g01041461 [Helianthus anomalus]
MIMESILLMAVIEPQTNSVTHPFEGSNRGTNKLVPQSLQNMHRVAQTCPTGGSGFGLLIAMAGS